MRRRFLRRTVFGQPVFWLWTLALLTVVAIVAQF